MTAENRIRLLHSSDEQRVDVTIDAVPFTSYIYPDTIMKPVLYPLRSARGTLVSRGYPLDPRPRERVDHPHHVGLWFNYGAANGLDFWNNSDAVPADKRDHYGTIRHREVVAMAGGPDHGTLDVTMEWVTPTDRVILQEDTRFVFSGDATTRIIDREATLSALDEDVEFTDDKEGLLGIRVARELEQPDPKPARRTGPDGAPNPEPDVDTDGVTGLYRSSNGTEGDAVWATRGDWVALTGKIGDETVSIVVFDHPHNPGYPTYWHARGYGLFAANPLGQEQFSQGKEALNFKLGAGESGTFRYRIMIDSRDDLPDECLNEAFAQFAGT